MKTVSFSQTALNAALKEALDAHIWGTIGPESKAAAQEFATLVGMESGLFCSTPAGAAETVLRALELSYGDEVVLPAYCSHYLKEAVEAVGAKCVFCDVDDTLSMDAGRLPYCFSEHTQAVFCEDVASFPCDTPALRQICKERDVPLICVSASAYETRISDRPTVSFADIALCAPDIQNIAVLVTREELIGKLYAAHHCGNPYGHPGGLNTGVCLGGDMRSDEFRPRILRMLLESADERRRAKNSLRIRLSEALIDNGAVIVKPRVGGDSAGDYVLCALGGRETCRDKADALPYRSYTEAARIAACGIVAYKTV